MSRKSTASSSRTTRSRYTDPTPDFKAFLASQQPPTSYSTSGTFRGPRSSTTDEEIPLPDSTRARSLTPAEADQALKDLFRGGTDNAGTFTDDAEGVVKGFRDNIRLLPHQIPSRAWMRDREDLVKKKAGGILADDMGLGKTIQATARILDGPPTKIDRQNGYAAATLVVCPLGVLKQWEAEIEKFTVGLRVIPYHDGKRGKVARLLSEANVVLTTYGVVCSEHATMNPQDRSIGSVLFTTKWWRIILDEAHTIKNRKTKTAEACWDLQARFRWCLTATPMQNKVDDFFPLLKFMHIKPLNEWELFNSMIAKPISNGSGANLAMKRLQVVLKQVMFRRTKLDVESVLKLPDRTVVVLSCEFDSSEQQFYTALRNNVKTLLQRILAKSEENGGATYMNVLVLLLRLRQACDHPCLVLDGYADDMEDVNPGTKLNMALDADSGSDVEADISEPRCHVCKSRLTRRNRADSKSWPDHCIDCAAFKVQAENLHSSKRASAKIRTLLKLLQNIAKESGGREKTVIFSQFTAMLDILESFLVAIGVRFARYDGQMTIKERTEALQEIERDPRTTVILVSLKAGGVGLNLTACNHVILVDMWWNPAVEEQAFDRTHRVGQKRNVHIYKLKIDDTVEDRILQLQEKKRQLTTMALSGSHIKNQKLGMHELLQLFK
ncbi:DNA repair protein RAD5 [Favolaschia claudopus]|uniref:DNA repair protein RAD5 n=1 Tax=Favolaschia claudopus TaxID=2862362 RepID=A0AAW0E383_9AGAR